MMLVFHIPSLSLAIDRQHCYVITVQIFYSIHFHLFPYQYFHFVCGKFTQCFLNVKVEPCLWEGLRLCWNLTGDAEKAPLTSVSSSLLLLSRVCTWILSQTGASPSRAGTWSWKAVMYLFMISPNGYPLGIYLYKLDSGHAAFCRENGGWRHPMIRTQEKEKMRDH